MEIIKGTFRCNSVSRQISIISMANGEALFKCRDVAKALGYARTRNAIERHIDSEDKLKFEDIQESPETWLLGRQESPETMLLSRQESPETGLLGRQRSLVSTHLHPHSLFTNISAVFSLVIGSNLPIAKVFKKWLTKTVLPSLRVMSTNNQPDTRNHLHITKYEMITGEKLHTKVVDIIKRYHKEAFIMLGLGENQNTSDRRIRSYRHGYTSRQCDLTIENYHKDYSGLCLEFKRGSLSSPQVTWLRNRERNGYRCLVSNDYDEIVKEIDFYMSGMRVKCELCKERGKSKNKGFLFKSERTLAAHKCGFHKRRQLAIA